MSSDEEKRIAENKEAEMRTTNQYSSYPDDTRRINSSAYNNKPRRRRDFFDFIEWVERSNGFIKFLIILVPFMLFLFVIGIFLWIGSILLFFGVFFSIGGIVVIIRKKAYLEDIEDVPPGRAQFTIEGRPAIWSGVVSLIIGIALILVEILI